MDFPNALDFLVLSDSTLTFYIASAFLATVRGLIFMETPTPPQNSWESGAELITMIELDNEAYNISKVNHRIINNYSSS